MPEYPIACECGFHGDVFARVAELRDGRCQCPDCGRYAEQDYAAKRIANGNREFHGERGVSLTEGWHADEVEKVHRTMIRHGDVDAANMVDREGNVRFRSRQDQQKYAAAKGRIWQSVADGPSDATDMDDYRAKIEAKKAAKAKPAGAAPETGRRRKRGVQRLEGRVVG